MVDWRQTIDVERLVLPDHETLEGATDAAAVRRAAGKRDTGLIGGAEVEDYGYNGRALALALSSGVVLTIYSEEHGVQWSVDESSACGIENDVLPAELHLRRPSGATQTWQWRRLLDRLKGHSVRAIAPGETILSLYVRDLPDLLFASLAIKGSGDRLLSFNEE